MNDESSVYLVKQCGTNGEVVKGPRGFKEFHHSFLNAFPDIKVEVVDTLVAGDKLAARCLVRGTHTGEGLGFKPTGRSAEFGMDARGRF